MANYNPKFDEYIEKSADFSKPILKHIREIAHRALPEIEEKIKWGMPFFDYEGPICNMAAFKSHCGFGFWKASLLSDPHGLLRKNSSKAMGQFAKITSLADLPLDEILIEYIREAAHLNKAGIKVSKKPNAPITALETPADFLEKLKEYPTAEQYFNKSSISHKKEYNQWFNDAKTESTRNKRMTTAIEWLSEGKSRNWKYERK